MPLFALDQLKTEQGLFKTKGLFLEQDYDYESTIMTYQEHDRFIKGKTYYSLRRLYVEHCLDDPTEYTLAMEVFGSWDVWSKIAASPTIRPVLDKAREECEVKRKAMASLKIRDELSEGKNSYQAAKYLIEEPWKVKAADTPEDKRKARAAARKTAESAYEVSGVEADLKRLKEEGLIQ